MSQSAQASAVQVFLIPTTAIYEYGFEIDLLALSSRINSTLKSSQFQFRVILKDRVQDKYVSPKIYRSDGLKLRHTRDFENFVPATNVTFSVGFQAARRTSIVDLDAFDQVKEWARPALLELPASPAILVGVGSEVVGPDDPEEEWTGIGEQDAYSCLVDIRTDRTNDDPRESQYICHISLARAYSSEVYRLYLWDPQTSKRRKRAIIERYIIVNVAMALANFLFQKPLVGECGNVCVANTNTMGGEQVSYIAEGLCDICRHEARGYGLAQNLRGALATVDEAFEAIEQLCRAPPAIDHEVGKLELLDKLREIALVVVATGLVVALFAAYDVNQLLSDYLKAHWPAEVAVVVLALLWYASRSEHRWLRWLGPFFRFHK